MYKVRATSPGQLYVGAVGLGARGTQRLLTYQLRLALDPEFSRTRLTTKRDPRDAIEAFFV